MTAYDHIVGALHQHGSTVKDSGQKATATCPAHDDSSPSLSLRRIEGQALIHCHAGCDTIDVLDALGMTMTDLFDEPKGATYTYTDLNGRPTREVHRSPDKRFRQTGHTKGTAQLYRLPQVAAAVAAGTPVYLVEGEKDVHALETLGAVATTSPMGAANWGKADPTPLTGAHVIIVPDRDEAGHKYAAAVVLTLESIAASVEVRLAKVGKDAADHIAAGHGLDDLEPAEMPERSDDATEAALEAAYKFAVAVDRNAYDLRVRDAARDKVSAEKAGTIDMPPVTRLDQFLAVPDEDITHRIAGLWPVGGRVVLSATHKAGKTTTVGNILRSLVDGFEFLGAFPVRRVKRVVLLDNELDERMLRKWLRDQGIGAATSIELVALRGRLSTFNILDAATRTRWAEHLGSADVLIFDCLRPALDALGLSEDKEAGRFLEALDELATEAGIPETLVVHHMGHNGERSRGDSRILDWPDAVWKLVKDGDDESDTRRVYFTAYGRDVDQPEVLLSYEPTTRWLSAVGGSRKDTVVESVAVKVIDYIAEHPGCSKNAIENGLGGRAEHVRAALDRAIEKGSVRQYREGSAHRHTLNSSTRPDSSRTRDEYLVHSSMTRDENEREVGEALVPDEVRCKVCTFPLHPAMAAIGETTHANCEEAS